MSTRSADDDALLERYVELGGALAEMFSPILEVIIHDYRRTEDSVVAVFNSHITGRKVGDPLTKIGHARVKGEEIDDLLVAYKNESPSGKPLKSASIAIRNDCGDLVGALCLNMDIAYFKEIGRFLEQFTATAAEQPTEGSSEFLMESPQDTINSAIKSYLIQNGLQTQSLSSGIKKEIVAHLRDQGLFNQKGAVTIVANELSLTRPSIYKYLKQ